MVNKNIINASKKINTIDIKQIQDLLFGDRIKGSELSRLTGITEVLIYKYRDGTVPFSSLSIGNARLLMAVANEPNLTKLPPGITAVPLNSGGISYRAQASRHGRPVSLGNYPSLQQAISARNEYIMAHRDDIKVVHRARVIEVSPELKAKVKATKGVNFYWDRKGRVTGFRAEFMRNRKKKYLGKFDTFEEAKSVYEKTVKALDKQD